MSHCGQWRVAVPRGAVPWSCAPPVPRCGRARCPHRAAAPSARCAAWHCAVWNRAPRWGAGVTGRRALRGYRGAHGDAPGKTLSVCPMAITPAHYPRPRAMRRDGDIAPYRHYTRNIRRQYSHAHYTRHLPTCITHGSPPHAVAHRRAPGEKRSLRGAQTPFEVTTRIGMPFTFRSWWRRRQARLNRS